MRCAIETRRNSPSRNIILDLMLLQARSLVGRSGLSKQSTSVRSARPLNATRSRASVGLESRSPGFLPDLHASR
jgi:hypothetical protein